MATDIEKHVKKICAHCAHYEIRLHGIPEWADGGAYCNYHRRFYPVQRKQPGDRRCEHWSRRCKTLA